MMKVKKKTCCHCSVTKSYPTLWDPMNCKMSDFPVFHVLLYSAQTQVHWLSDDIKLPHSLSLPSPPALNLSQHHGLSRWVCFLHQVAKALELQLQAFQWIFKVDFLWDWLVWSTCWPRDSQESSPEPQIKSINSSALNLLYGPTLISVRNYRKNHRFDYTDLCQQSDVFAF